MEFQVNQNVQSKCWAADVEPTLTQRQLPNQLHLDINVRQLTLGQCWPNIGIPTPTVKNTELLFQPWANIEPTSTAQPIVFWHYWLSCWRWFNVGPRLEFQLWRCQPLPTLGQPLPAIWVYNPNIYRGLLCVNFATGRHLKNRAMVIDREDFFKWLYPICLQSLTWRRVRSTSVLN